MLFITVIINLSSISQSGNAGQTNYSAAKAGVSSMTVVWAKELGAFGIRVAAIAPGFMKTDMVDSIHPDIVKKMTKFIPLQRMGEPDEVSKAAIFIVENDYYTGRVLELDGGLRV
ncbi:MAG: 3-oxoacyl-[acyl-carrier protein] reductase [bacterium]|jgi:3-oxoacyl-[acyl-carrier protein] reductase